MFLILLAISVPTKNYDIFISITKATILGFYFQQWVTYSEFTSNWIGQREF